MIFSLKFILQHQKHKSIYIHFTFDQNQFIQNQLLHIHERDILPLWRDTFHYSWIKWV